MLRRLDESDPEFIPVVGELEMEFRTDLLRDDNQHRVPLIFVNRETHNVALSWLDEHVCFADLILKQHDMLLIYDYIGYQD